MSASNRNKSKKGLSRKQKKQLLKECAPARENPAVPEKHPAKHSERETSCNGDDRTAEPLSSQAPEPELFKDTASAAAEQNFHFRVDGFDFVIDLPTAHIRHNDVQNSHFDFIFVGFKNFNGLGAI